ncbi:diguanylate cyclase domain-containing protein [Massilia sp. Mn16-1_5]|uniref:sensor domain-containing diguanylate cyclase n=1 Tax=Massilia sp. Mn16-1_5 TaxID=2079199 RepID=UPI00109EB30A|nr:diguanylate cyclase [Massilia sp. Mn16-1_5]THC42250.1 sensor domain-containing diguanylate cyclase [Massilia sp. Mn16-1_5]
MPQRPLLSLRPLSDASAYFRPDVLRRLAVFLAVVLPLVWLFVAHERKQLGELAHEESNRNVRNLAHAFAEEVRSSIVTIDLSLSQLRLSWLRNPEQFATIVAELNHNLQGQMRIEVGVTDADGRLVFSSVRGAPGQVDLADRDHVGSHLRGERSDRLFIGKPITGKVSGRWTVYFSRPIFDARGKLAGVIVAGIEPAYFSRFYSTIDLGHSASIALVRTDGIVVARTTRDLTQRDSGKLLTGYPYSPDSGPGGNFHRISRMDGLERYYGWRALSDYGLLVTVGQSVHDAHARYAEQRELLVYTGVAISLLLALAGWAALAASDHRRRAVASLAAAEARWKLALNAAGEGVWDYSFANRLVTLSPSAQGIVDLERSLVEFDRAIFADMAHPEDIATVLQALDAHLIGATPDYTAQYRTRLRNGNWRWILARGQVAERDAAGSPLRIVGTVADIDARKLQEEQIRHLAHHDVLTGLPNRLLFGDRLHQALLAAQRESCLLGLVFFDLDKFKPVNDNYGHAIGDLLLQQVATRLRGILRASDTLARLGGDEFVVLLPRVSGTPDVRKVAEDILRELNRPFVTEGFTLHISGSLGVAVYPDDAMDADSLMRCADAAMYQAKLQGRGRVAEYVAPAPKAEQDQQPSAVERDAA